MMRKIFLSILPVAALFAATPAAALTKGQADCPVQLVDPKISQALISQMVDHEEGEEIDEKVLDGVFAVYETCVKREAVPEDQRDDYIGYVTGSIASAELARQLKVAGINPATVDLAFDIGPGARNPDPDDFEDEDFERLRTLLAKDGIFIEKLDRREVGLIGAYAAISAALWKVREKLN